MSYTGARYKVNFGFSEVGKNTFFTKKLTYMSTFLSESLEEIQTFGIFSTSITNIFVPKKFLHMSALLYELQKVIKSQFQALVSIDFSPLIYSIIGCFRAKEHSLV